MSEIIEIMKSQGITKQKNNLRISWILSDHATFGRIVGVPFGKAINDSIESANQSIVRSIQRATNIYSLMNTRSSDAMRFEI